MGGQGHHSREGDRPGSWAAVEPSPLLPSLLQPQRPRPEWHLQTPAGQRAQQITFEQPKKKCSIGSYNSEYKTNIHESTLT